VRLAKRALSLLFLISLLGAANSQAQSDALVKRDINGWTLSVPPLQPEWGSTWAYSSRLDGKHLTFAVFTVVYKSDETSAATYAWLTAESKDDIVLSNYREGDLKKLLLAVDTQNKLNRDSREFQGFVLASTGYLRLTLISENVDAAKALGARILATATLSKK
jgi:hypothetical protein